MQNDNSRYRQRRSSESYQPFPDFPEHPDYGDDYNENETENRSDRQPKKERPPRKRKKGRVLKILLSIILIAVLLFGVYFSLIIFRIHYTNENPDEESIVAEAGELQSDENVQNVLIFGTDHHDDDEYGRSDSIILLSIDKQNHCLKQTSFLRDIYLTIPGYGEDKLNAAYSYGGPKLAAETIEYNFRIRIDQYAIIDFESFTTIIDALGGIDLHLTYDEVDYIDWQSHKNKQTDTRHELDADSYTYETDEDGNETALVHLNGRQSLWYARDRDSEGSDFDRTSRQRTVINTVFSQLKSSNPITFMHVLCSAAPMITTNMSVGDVVAAAFGSIGYLNYEREEYRVPRGDNFSNSWAGDAAVLTIDDMDYERESLYDFIYHSNDE